MDSARLKRKEDIKKSLLFIQSSLAYPEPENFQDFLTQLVCNLLEEGNALFRDGEWEQATREFGEGLNVSDYALAEELQIPEALLESLYVNRAAAYHSMGAYDQGVQDCDRALDVCTESRRALYRKALCLKELGRYKEAYDCTTDCLLITRLDKQVNELAQELAVHLGLKNRKPYVSSKLGKEDALITRSVTNGNMTAEATEVCRDNIGNGINPLRSFAPVTFPSMPQSSSPLITTVAHQPAVSVGPDVVDTLEDTELMGDDLDSLLDCYPNEQQTLESQTQAQVAFSVSVPCRASSTAPTVPPVLPAPTPQLPPAFFSSAISQLNSLDSFSGSRCSTTAPTTLDALDFISTPGIIGSGVSTSNFGLDALDTLDGLDSLDDFSDTSPGAAAVNDKDVRVGEKSLDDLLDELNLRETVSDAGSQTNNVLQRGVKAVEMLDSLDSFPSTEGVGVVSAPVSFGGTGFDLLSDFSSTGIPGAHTTAPPVSRSPKNNSKVPKEKSKEALAASSNPLSSTHEFLPACSACFPQKGKGIYTFVHLPDLVHGCRQDILLCRRKSESPSEWTRVRKLPSWTSFHGPFVLCKELLKSGDLGLCKYGERCNFAFNQLEIDVWTEERKGTLDRNLLFETAAGKLDPVTRIIRLLQENKGVFVFLCQQCYDNKPRIISKRSKENPTVCSNLDVRHNFDANKCLAFVVRTHSVNYRKVRPLSVLCQLDLCRKAIRYGCQREDSCFYAHSVIELKTWNVQRDTGISPDEIVKVSTQYNDKQEQILRKQKGNRLSSGDTGSKPKAGGGKNLNMNMKFACAICWRDGQISEPDKALKNCSAKAKHTWNKERWLLLVKSMERNRWVEVRPLPHAKNFPLYYDICTQILEKRKCNYSGKCTFAHSQEERDMWMYMKNNDLKDMQQMYDMWVILTRQNRQSEGATVTHPTPEEKYIVMPTDYAEPMVGFKAKH